MATKLDIGDDFPDMTLNLVDGGTAKIPDLVDAKYQMILFYRGHWWPYCRRQLVGFEKEKSTLEAEGIKVIAASIDTGDEAKLVADEVSFPIGQGVTRDQARQIDAWWEDRRGIIQPSEFLLGDDGKVVSSSYSAGPLARMDAADVIKLVQLFERRKAEAQQ